MKFPLREWKIFYFAISYNNNKYSAPRLSTQCADNLGTVKTWLHILIYYFNESDSSSLIFNKTNLNLLLNVLYHIVMEMKIRESCLQTGTFIYKPGLSFTNRESRLQNRTFIYKEGVLCYKWDSQLTIYPNIIIFFT